MPRYRFSWDNLPRTLLAELGRDLSLQMPVTQTLRDRYGARPRPEFVRDAWPTLLRVWLPKDRGSRDAVVAGLQARRLGTVDSPVRSPAAQLEYLKSCRNSISLREVVVAVFMAFGESETIRTPIPVEASGTARPSRSPDRGEQASNGGAGSTPASLDDWLGWAVAQILGVDQAPRDSDGDIPIRSGSSMCYVRSIEDPPSVRLFAPMVVDVSRTSALLEALNDINMSITVGRVFHTPANEVIFALELYGDQLTVEIIRASLGAATYVADRFDDEIQFRFGGRTLFAETNDDSVLV